LEQEVGQGDTEVTGELTTVSSSNNTNPFFEEVGKNPFLEDDKNPFYNNNDDDDDDDKNPFKESKSTNPFDEDEGKSGPKQKLINVKLSRHASNYFIYLWCVQLFNFFRASGIIITWFKQLKVSQGMCNIYSPSL